MTFFYLIRHAHADWTTDEQRPLSDKGQAGAGRLADLLHDLPIARICSSPYRRALQTVEPLAIKLGLPVHLENDLRERELGEIPKGSSFLEAVKWTWENFSLTLPRGESNEAAKRRGVAVLQRLLVQHPGEHLLLSTHGNLMALLLQHFDSSVDFSFWQALTMPDVYQLCVEKDQGSVVRLWQSKV